MNILDRIFRRRQTTPPTPRVSLIKPDDPATVAARTARAQLAQARQQQDAVDAAVRPWRTAIDRNGFADLIERAFEGRRMGDTR